MIPGYGNPFPRRVRQYLKPLILHRSRALSLGKQKRPSSSGWSKIIHSYTPQEPPIKKHPYHRARILSKSTTRCLPKNVLGTMVILPRGYSISFYAERRRSRENADSSEERERAETPGKRSACNRCSRKGDLWSVAYRGIIYWNCRYGSRWLFYPRMRTRVRMCNSSGEGFNRECLIFLTV